MRYKVKVDILVALARENKETKTKRAIKERRGWRRGREGGCGDREGKTIMFQAWEPFRPKRFLLNVLSFWLVTLSIPILGGLYTEENM